MDKRGSLPGSSTASGLFSDGSYVLITPKDSCGAVLPLQTSRLLTVTCDVFLTMCRQLKLIPAEPRIKIKTASRDMSTQTDRGSTMCSTACMTETPRLASKTVQTDATEPMAQKRRANGQKTKMKRQRTVPAENSTLNGKGAQVKMTTTTTTSVKPVEVVNHTTTTTRVERAMVTSSSHPRYRFAFVNQLSKVLSEPMSLNSPIMPNRPQTAGPGNEGVEVQIDPSNAEILKTRIRNSETHIALEKQPLDFSRSRISSTIPFGQHDAHIRLPKPARPVATLPPQPTGMYDFGLGSQSQLPKLQQFVRRIKPSVVGPDAFGTRQFEPTYRPTAMYPFNNGSAGVPNGTTTRMPVPVMGFNHINATIYRNETEKSYHQQQQHQHTVLSSPTSTSSARNLQYIQLETDSRCVK